MTTKKLRIFHSEDERDFLAWIGLYVTTWSGIEHSLLICLETLSLITKEKFEHKPIAFKSKLKKFRKAFNHSLLEDELEEVDAIISFLESESDFRHSIIHGVNARLLLPKGEWFNQQWMPERHKTPENDNITVVDQTTLEDHYHKTGRAILSLISINRRTLNKLEQLITESESNLRI